MLDLVDVQPAKVAEDWLGALKTAIAGRRA